MNESRRKMIQHKGKTIAIHDYSGLDNQDYVDAIMENAKLAEEENYPVSLILVDATNTVVSKDVMKVYKSATKKASANISKTAVIGVTGIQQLFIATVATFAKVDVRGFKSKEEALDWLVS